jgi:hypothetical protein
MNGLRRFLVRRLLPDLLLCQRCGCFVRPALHRCVVTEVPIRVQSTDLPRQPNGSYLRDVVNLPQEHERLFRDLLRASR